ncbi:uncharacterized protein LACBIDRAFT_305084 [Laccaria bicolor S238N-H82]|uniref:Predicted protein n=1 Tax=Laccaria bicolor (strain S238N-H82 / ATCC MYA-4686) TaxID=486041 RepID=B0CTD6_LACBS|nr:uncharacterized protein LACBIDRAFT_305084 [Laccaria bicolor S238N-H82]EDR13899.1 predicted protein [Laccaria bicolor S238N-H82]|eukprot:XP_001874458.1 predicted protein [Laccaria bicolor S238N-H82]
MSLHSCLVLAHRGICKTNFTLGWPANPRDAVTISCSFHDPTTVINISTSLPRSPDEPAYLRPSPPFVRSHVKYDQLKKPPSRIRITCFWQHDLKAMLGFGSTSAGVQQQLSTMVLSMFKSVIKRGERVPKLVGYGHGVSIGRVRYQVDREALTVDYSILPDDEDHLGVTPEQMHGVDEVQVIREQRRLTRSVECILPSLEGWDVLVSVKASSEELVIEVSGASRGLRLNGLPKTIYDSEPRDPQSYGVPQAILADIASAVDLSVQTSASSLRTTGTSVVESKGPGQGQMERSPAAEKTILSKVRRNYIYFSSLLQEPEAKWRRTTEARGVSITQLDSIDPTLVVYRAEATFVGVGLWDLYGAVISPGARIYWDKQHEDAVLLEDVNELTEMWHFKTKRAWPVTGRDAVVLKTVYKSPTTIHVFSFSVDSDSHLFPHIPPLDPNTIRTQVDLQGWAIESLSPTTTLLTLLEQSDPKGWTNKTSVLSQMINPLAGIGEFAIKCGGPPVVTRLGGAKMNEVRYDHEKGSFKVEYEVASSRRMGLSSSSSGGGGEEGEMDSNAPNIECEIRCDVDTWASSLGIVVDPPPQSISCLRRHRLSLDGGGLWLTLSHDSVRGG